MGSFENKLVLVFLFSVLRSRFCFHSFLLTVVEGQNFDIAQLIITLLQLDILICEWPASLVELASLMSVSDSELLFWIQFPTPNYIVIGESRHFILDDSWTLLAFCCAGSCLEIFEFIVRLGWIRFEVDFLQGTNLFNWRKCLSVILASNELLVRVVSSFQNFCIRKGKPMMEFSRNVFRPLLFPLWSLDYRDPS